ncbi:hypothetical protein KKC17_02200 [Patescibacteria group bacterium]|nr:hypothetical protein [Patescibacteria group bacterium]
MPINLNLEPQTNLGTEQISWSFKEFNPIIRSRRWWWLAGVISLLLLLYAVLTGNFLFALILLMGAILFVNETKRQPRHLKCQITNKGLAVGKKFWRWSELNEFWIAYQPPTIDNLYVLPKNLFDPRLSIPLNKTNPLKVRTELKKFLNEDLSKEDEPTSEALAKLLKLQ